MLSLLYDGQKYFQITEGLEILYILIKPIHTRSMIVDPSDL